MKFKIYLVLKLDLNVLYFFIMRRILLLISLFFLFLLHLSAQKPGSRTAAFLDSLNALNDPVNWGEGLEYIRNVEEMSEIAMKEEEYSIYESCRISIQMRYYEMSDFIGFERAINESMKFVNDTLNSTWLYQSAILNDKSLLYRFMGDFRQAIDLRLETIDLVKEQEEINIIQLGMLYRSLIVDYNSIGNYVKARQYCLEGLEMFKDDSLYYFEKSFFYCCLGYIDIKELRFESANTNYNKSDSLLTKEKNKANHIQYLKIDNSIRWAESCIYLNEMSKAKLLIEEVVDLQKELNYRELKTFEIKSKYYSKLDNYEATLLSIQEAIKCAINTLRSESDYAALPKMYLLLAEFHDTNNQYVLGLDATQRGLCYFADTLVKDVAFNPPLQDIHGVDVALNLLVIKAKMLNHKYNSSAYEEDYQSAIRAYKATIDIVSNMRKSFISGDSKFYVLEKALPVYDSYLEMVYDHFLVSDNLSDKEFIYNIIGETKSVILSDNVNYKNQVEDSKIPQELIEAERELRMKKTLYTKQVKMMDLQDSLGSNEKLAELKNKLFSLNQDYDILDKRIRELNSDVGQFNRNVNLSVLEFMNFLEDGEMVIDYYASTDYIYSVALFNDEIFVDRIEISEVESSIINFVQQVSRPPSMTEGEDDMTKLSEVIVKKLLKPYLENRDAVKKLRIFPSGILNSLPFEALSYESEGESKYLINDCSVLYSVSRSQLLQKKEVENDKSVFAVAPIFDSEVIVDTRYACDGAELANLKYAQEEVEFINRTYSIEASGDSVSSAYFLSNVSNHNICHLATHGCVNTSDPLLSEIYFSDGPVTAYDILNLDSDISLMFLSACNTAKGQDVQGEGVIGLTSGFFEAGVKNMISSLWSIDDFSSSQIVKGFYKNLNAGKTYSQALRSSKLEYLEGADKLRSHPYYWAGLVQIGAGVTVEESSNWWMYLLGFGVLLLLFLWSKSRR